MLVEGLEKAGREWRRLGRTREGWVGLGKAERDWERLGGTGEGR